MEDLRKKVTRKVADFDLIRRQVVEEKARLETAQQATIVLREAQELAQEVAQQVQQRAHKQIASVVSRCLESVFDEPYNFKIIFERKRGRTEAQLVFERDGTIVDPMTASGGGVVDVAAFALRLSCLMLSRPPLRRLLILDEPFKFVSSTYRGRIRHMMEELSKELKVQFVMVTHIKEFEMGKVLRLGGE